MTTVTLASLLTLLVALKFHIAFTKHAPLKYVPSTASPGHVITLLPYRNGQISRILSDSHFAVTNTGELITTSHISHLSGRTLRVAIEHTLSSNKWSETLHLHIRAASDKLQFTQGPYVGHIRENLPPGSVLNGIDALLEDIRNFPYGCKVELASGDTADFHVDQWRNHTQIVTDNSFDREHKDDYYFVLQVTCPQFNPAYAMVQVKVDDENDNRPVFSANIYHATLPRELAANYANVTRVRSSDADSDDSVRYALVDSSTTFGINCTSGDIFMITAALLPKDYELSVIATDAASHTSSPSLVRIHVTEGSEAARQDVTRLASRVKRSAQTERVFVIRKQITGDLFSVASVPAKSVERFVLDTQEDGFDKLRLDSATGVVTRVAGHQWSDDQVVLRGNVNVTRIDDPEYFRVIPIAVYPVERGDYDVIFTNVPRPLWTTVPMWVRPGTTIFTVKAIDAVEYGAEVIYRLESGGAGRFTVDKHTGEVQVVGRKMFTEGYQYELAISAQVVGTISNSFTLAQVLHVQVEDLKPQFYQSPRYEIDLIEDTPPGSSFFQIKAKSFQEIPIRYSMQTQHKDLPFNLEPTSGDLTLTRVLRYSHDLHQYRLTVTAREPDSGIQSETEVLINIIAVNRHAPYFAPEMYVAHDVDETIGVDVEILTVTVTDLDLGDNGKVTFNSSDDHFVVTTVDGKTGSVRANKRLDYDFQPQHMYEFIVTATDGGNKIGTVRVRVLMANRNDEAPVFQPAEQKIRVKDFSPKSMLVHPVQASDPDGDRLTYRIVKSEPVVSAAIFPFEIDSRTGHITMSKSAQNAQPNYNLTIEVTDDGSCCTQASSTHSSIGHLLIMFIGVNHPPIFDNCPHPVSGGVKVKEGMPKGTSVINITAHDDDSGENGQVEFSLNFAKHITDGRFLVRSVPGGLNQHMVELLTKQEFLREDPFPDAYIVNGQVLYRVTIVVTDKGEHPLSSTCFFFVTIDDINNNQPRFDETIYQAAILPSTSIGYHVIRLFAIDDDEADNALVRYTLTDDGGCSNCFSLDRVSGWLDVSSDLRSRPLGEFSMTVQATDSGDDPQTSDVSVVVKLTNDVKELAPQWALEPGGIMLDDKQISIPENITQASELDLKLGVRRRVPEVRPRRTIKLGRTVQENKYSDFTLRYDNFFNAFVRIVNRLDYERVQRYYLKLMLADGSKYSSIARLTVDITDINDNLPLFQGQDLSGQHTAAVSDSTKEGDYVLTIHAFDLDGTSPNNKVTYRWNETCADCESFRIDKDTGRIVAARSDFRRTVRKRYDLAVVASDGAPSTFSDKGQPNTEIAIIWVKVSGTSIHPPYFETKQYEFEIDEAQPINTTIATLRATSKDNIIIQYSIISGNEDNLFAIDLFSGRLFIQSTTSYDKKATHELKIRAFDGGDEDDVASVIVKLTSRNMHAPVFKPYIHTVTTLEEMVLPPRGILAQVSATDPDVSRQSLGDIRYSLAGVHASHFDISTQTGTVSLLQALSRDYPKGHANWQVNVVATDDGGASTGLQGYGLLQVQLIDTNNLAPVFDTCCLEGHVQESRIPDTSRKVMDVKATDYDSGANGRVYFEMVSTAGSKFRLENRGDGQAEIMTTGSHLNRLEADHYIVTIRAYDGGSPSMEVFQNITIYIDDIDNQAPVFEKALFSATVPEMQPVGASVVMVTASDKDIGVNAQRTCSIHTSDRDGSFFSIDSIYSAGTCVVKIKSPLDYDRSTKRKYEFRALVHDENPAHPVSTCTVVVDITDINDNAPVITPREKSLQLMENVAVDSVIAKFDATDIDSAENSLYEFTIDYKNTDRLKKFKIDRRSGEVRIRRALDRETDSSYAVHILATDKGEPAQTGTATLLLNITDINDNAPQLSGGGIDGSDAFVVGKNDLKGSKIGVVSATDLDSPENGAPYVFKLDCNSIQCADFRIETNADGKSASIISSRDGFSSDGFLSYSLPISVSDSPSSGEPSLTSTATVTVMIDSGNSYKPKPGHMSIDVFLLADDNNPNSLALGTPMTEDEDDNDLADKSFQFVGSHDGFTLVEKRLMMQSSVRHGTYQLQVSVTDSVWQETVISTVTVNVLTIDEALARSAGSVRFEGMTAEQFLHIPEAGKTSPCTRFKNTMAEFLKTNASNVHVISLAKGPSGSLDVYFIAHGSPWYRTSRLNGLVWTNKAKISESVEADVVMSPLSGCLTAQCYDGGCTDEIQLLDEPIQIETKRGSFLGVGLKSVTSCQCATQLVADKCTPTTCLNQGKCTNATRGYKCECLAGFTGPRCQQLKQSFTGDGWAWYDPLTSCDNTKTSFQFLTSSQNGLLLYNGPMYDGDVTVDYIAVELTAGHVRVRIDLGAGEVVLQVQGDQKLNDGKWHSVELFQKQQELRLVIDHCDSSDIDESIKSTSEHRASCEDMKQIPGEDSTLDVNTPLQLGGRSSSVISRPAQLAAGFTGCIKELRHNGILYDLHIGVQGQGHNTADNCPPEEQSCEQCVNNGGICEGSLTGTASCVCPPGFKGPKCDQETAIREFYTSQSYIEWKLIEAFNSSLPKRSFHLQLNFRTRQSDGVIFSVDSFSTLERYRLEIVESHLQFRYDLGAGDFIVRLATDNVNDGVWHTATVSRHGLHVRLWLDDGEADKYAESDIWTHNYRLLTPGRGLMFGGAEVTRKKYVKEPKRTRVFFNSCVSDVRYNHQPFPMAGSNDIVKVTASVSTRDTCSSAVCRLDICPAGQQCVDLWRKHQCVCPVGMKIAAAPVFCVDITDCSVPRCVNGLCYVTADSWGCHCYEGWTGRNCSMIRDPEAVSAEATVSGGLIAIIIICLLILLLALLFVALFVRRRKQNNQLLVVDPDDDVRENVGFYDEEGAGEEDAQGYDLSRLQKPADNDADSLTKPPLNDMIVPRTSESKQGATPVPRPDDSDVGDFIDDRLREADGEGTEKDSVRGYAYEGGGSTAGSLSSLASSSDNSDIDFNYLQDFGPRFRRLADLYGDGEDDEENASVV